MLSGEGVLKPMVVTLLTGGGRKNKKCFVIGVRGTCVNLHSARSRFWGFGARDSSKILVLLAAIFD